MLLENNGLWRMYLLDGRYVNKIYFFNENGVQFDTYSGWLEHKTNDVKKIELNIENVPLKRKFDFKLKAFKISVVDRFKEKHYDLYLNLSLFEKVKEEYAFKTYDFECYLEKYVTFKSNDQLFTVSKVVESLDYNHERYTIRNEMQNKFGTLYDINSNKLNEYIELLEKEKEKIINIENQLNDFKVRMKEKYNI